MRSTNSFLVVARFACPALPRHTVDLTIQVDAKASGDIDKRSKATVPGRQHELGRRRGLRRLRQRHEERGPDETAKSFDII